MEHVASEQEAARVAEEKTEQAESHSVPSLSPTKSAVEEATASSRQHMTACVESKMERALAAHAPPLPTIFFSLRFGAEHGVVPMAEALREAMAEHGVAAQIVNMEAGGDIDLEVFSSIERCESFLVFGSAKYGEDTGNQACTYNEYKHAHARKKCIILLRMIPFDQDFEELQARVIFGANKLVLQWIVGEPMPADLPDRIIKAISPAAASLAKPLGQPTSMTASLSAAAAAADVRMAEKGYHTHFALQAPPVAIGGSAVQATLHERLCDITDMLQGRQASLTERKCFPICLSDASASSCDVEFQLRDGLINCLVWCAKGAGWESRADADDQMTPTLTRIGEIVKRLPASASPRVSVVCLQYGARVAAQQLHEAGIVAVIWLSGVDMLGDIRAALFCDVVLQAILRLQAGEDGDDVTRFVRTCLAKLTRAEDTLACGYIGSRIVKPWQPADTAGMRPWLTTLPAPQAIERINLNVASSFLKDLSLYACDLSRLGDCRAQLQRSKSVMIVSGDAKHAEHRRRAIGATLCAEPHDYGQVLHVSSAEQLRQASQSSAGRSLIWLDFLGTSTAEDVNAIQEMLTDRLTALSAIVIITYDDAFDSNEASADAVEDLAEALACEDVKLEEETGLLDVHADECVDDFKLVARFSEDHDKQHSLLNVFDAQQLATILQEQLDGRPIVGIYHADEANGILFRVAVSDVAFLHSIRDQFLQGIFSHTLVAALRDEPRQGSTESLGELCITVDQSHFAEQYYSSILRLNKLTAHQRKQLDKVRDTEKSVHVKAPAGAGKTFIALHLMLEVLQDDASNTSVLFAAPAAGLAFFVVRWIVERVGGRERKINRLLSRLHLLFAPFDVPSIATIKDSGIKTRSVERCKDYSLVVIDEAHHIFRDDRLRTTVESYSAARYMLLSDVSQSLHDGVPFPDDLEPILLEEVVRCSKRVVSAASKFQPEGTTARCHHNSDGPPLMSFLYDDDLSGGAAAQFELCATQTIRALEHVTMTFGDLNLNNRVAIIVPDGGFRRQLARPLEHQLCTEYQDKFEMLDAVQASRICNLASGTASRSGKQTIIVDELSQLDGTEFLIVICVGLDTLMGSGGEPSEAAFTESRSRLYRGITRAHMLALVVNAFVPGGWLEYLTTVRLKKGTVQADHRTQTVKSTRMLKEQQPRLDAKGTVPAAPPLFSDPMKSTCMSKEQQARLDADKKRTQERRHRVETFMQEKILSTKLGTEEAAFITQKIIAALSRPEHDLEAVFANARSVEWPRQQQLDRIPRLVAEVETIDDTGAIGALRQLATAELTSSGDMTAEQAVELALSSWHEVGTTIKQLIKDKALSVADAQQSSMQVNVASDLARGREVHSTASALLEEWVLDDSIQRAFLQLKQQLGKSKQLRTLRPLQAMVTGSLRQGLSIDDSISAALTLMQVADTALQALAVNRQIADPLTWCPVEDVVQDCVGLEGDELVAAVSRRVAHWEAQKKHELEAQKEEQSIWDSSGNVTARVATQHLAEKQAEQERLVREKTEREQLARQKAEQERLAAKKIDLVAEKIDLVGWCTKGAFAKQGRQVGQVLEDPNPDGEVKVCWSDGSMSEYMKAMNLAEANAVDQRSAADWCSEGVYGKYQGRIGVLMGSPDRDAQVKLKWDDDGTESSWVKAVCVHPPTEPEPQPVDGTTSTEAGSEAQPQTPQLDRQTAPAKETATEQQLDPATEHQLDPGHPVAAESSSKSDEPEDDVVDEGVPPLGESEQPDPEAGLTTAIPKLTNDTTRNAESALTEQKHLALEGAEWRRQQAEEAASTLLEPEPEPAPAPAPEPEPAVRRSIDEIWDDDHPVLVIDVGSTMCKAGLSGSDSPKVVFPSVYAKNGGLKEDRILETLRKGDPGSVRSRSNLTRVSFLLFCPAIR
eukprot:COSAG02_NODE_56_length_43700_cov_33.650765_2_plen_1893_part_00